MEVIRIGHFSDVLCVWAYVSQIRCDELCQRFPGQVTIDTRYIQVFGSVRAKMQAQWEAQGGIAAYAQHVKEVAASFDHVDIHPDVWVANTPESSLPAHLYLCAVRTLVGTGRLGAEALERAAWSIRSAFFAECADVGARPVLLQIGERAGVSAAMAERVLDSGEAHAALSADLDLAREHSVRASPTLLLNEGRQRLTGNVGYRVMEANVRELLEGPAGQHSWC